MNDTASLEVNSDHCGQTCLSPQDSLHVSNILHEDDLAASQIRLGLSSSPVKALNVSHFSNAISSFTQRESLSKLALPNSKNGENLSGHLLRAQQRSNITINLGTPRGSIFNTFGNNMNTPRASKKPKFTKVSLFSALKWKKFSYKWINQTSIGRFRKLTAHQFCLLNDNASEYAPHRRKVLLPQESIKKMNSSRQTSLIGFESKSQSLFLNFLNSNCVEFLLNFKRLEWFNCEVKWLPVFSPTGRLRFVWDLVLLVVILAFMFMIPVAICFGNTMSDMFDENLLFTCKSILITDIVLAWNFGYFEKGLPIMKRSQIAQNYLLNGFLVDLMSYIVLGMDTFFNSSGSTYGINYLHLIFFFKITSVNRIFKKIEERFHLTPKVTQISQLVQLLFLVITVTHFFACMWITVSLQEYDANIVSWIQKMNFNESDWVSQYICAYYFSTVTMITVGYGDFVPVNNVERTIGIIAMLISCVVFAYSLNAIGEIFTMIGSKQRQIQADLYLINNFMIKKHIDQKLMYEIREFLEYSWQMASDRNQEKEALIFNQLNPQLKEKLFIETYQMVIKRYEVFKKNFSESFVMSLIEIIEESAFRPDQWINNEVEGRHCDDLFFLESGKAMVCEAEENDQTPVHFLSVGESFGEVAFFSGQPQDLKLKAVEFTTVLRIRRQRFIQLIATFPHDYEIFKHIQDRILYAGDYSAIDIKCYSCSSKTHSLSQCPFTHLVLQPLPVIKRFVKEEWSARSKVERRSFEFPTLLLQVMVNECSIRYEVQNPDTIAQYVFQHLQNIQEDYMESEFDRIENENNSDQSSSDSSQQDENANNDSQQSKSANLEVAVVSSKELLHQSNDPGKSPRLSNTLTNIPETVDLSESNKLKPIHIRTNQLMLVKPNAQQKQHSSAISQISAVQRSSFTIDQTSHKEEIQEGQKTAREIPTLKRMSTHFQQMLRKNSNSNNNNNNNAFGINNGKFRQLIAEIASTCIELQQANTKAAAAEIFMSKQSKEDNSFEVQHNYKFYMPQNNLKEILQFLRFKRRVVKSLRESGKHQPVIQSDKNFHVFIKQSSNVQPGSITDYSILRKYEQQNNIKKMGNYIKNQQYLSSTSAAVAQQPVNSRFRRLLTRYNEDTIEEKDIAPANNSKDEYTFEQNFSKKFTESENNVDDHSKFKPSGFLSYKQSGGSNNEQNESMHDAASVEENLPITICMKRYEIYMERKKPQTEQRQVSIQRIPISELLNLDEVDVESPKNQEDICSSFESDVQSPYQKIPNIKEAASKSKYVFEEILSSPPFSSRPIFSNQFVDE